MSFFVRSPRSKPNKKAGMWVAIIAGIAAANGVFASRSARGTAHRGGDIGSTSTLLIFGGIFALPIICFVVMKLVRRGDDEPREDEMNSGNTMSDSSSSDETNEEDGNGQRRVVLIAIAAALAAVGVALFAYASTARAQDANDRGAFVVMHGADTIIVDRFSRTAETLRGSVSIKGQPRAEYVVAMGSGDAVRSLLVTVVKADAAPGDPPLQKIMLSIDGDSATGTMGATTTRVGTKPGAVPSFGNCWAIFEIFTRRARATGGTGDYPYLAISGATTLPLTVRPIDADSLLMTVAGQEMRYKVDAAGRILGGRITAQNVVITRVSEREAAKISFGNVVAPPAAKPDYSAPRDAPYTAEEVSFKGRGGITLGGTLTKPIGAHGPLPAVVTITGSGQEDRDEYVPLAGGVRLFRQVADTLSRVGIAVLRLDDRGYGASTGNFANSNTADFADDIRAGLTYLRSRPDIDAGRLALVGHSEGGIIAPMIAATDPALKAIAIFAGPADKMMDVILQQQKWVADHNPKLSQGQRDSVLAASRIALAPDRQFVPAMKFWMAYDPGPTARKVKASTLILQGATDRQVPVANAEKLASLIRSGGNKDVTVRLFPATDHLFLEDSTGDFLDMYKHVKSNKVSPAILGALADWLVAKIGTAPVVK
jgi:uncharacterized protein